MNIIFLSLDDFSSINERGTYSDVLREFVNQGNYVCAISPTSDEKKKGFVHDSDLCDICKPLIINSQKTNLIKKGLSIATIAKRIKYAIKKSNILSHKKFDLILYATPPVTIAPVIDFLKRKNLNATSFLLLKDMWPQVAIDVGMLADKGIKGILSDILRLYEEKIYKLSDYIGCMSPRNIEYVLTHNDFLTEENILVCPNSMEPYHPNLAEENYRQKYGIRNEDIVLLYGGNIGKMQGIPFLCECLKAVDQIEKIRFVVCGKGTEFDFLKSFVNCNNLKNAVLINGLPRDEFETLTSTCDYGMVFLDWRATTPNFPSRILPYMNNSKPIIACTDTATDVGQIIEENGFGWWSPSNDVEAFKEIIQKVLANKDYGEMCEKSRRYLLEHYTSKETVSIIKKAIM